MKVMIMNGTCKGVITSSSFSFSLGETNLSNAYILPTTNLSAIDTPEVVFLPSVAGRWPWSRRHCRPSRKSRVDGSKITIEQQHSGLNSVDDEASYDMKT